MEFPAAPPDEASAYFSELLIEVYLSFRLVPRPLTTAMIASEMPAAIRPYSIAVAPDSLDKNCLRMRFNSASIGVVLAAGQHLRHTLENLRFNEPHPLNL